MKHFFLVVLFVTIWQSTAIAAVTRVSQNDYIVGGILGTIPGFGVGHAIQNRYESKGWIFTAGEVAGVAAGITGALLPSHSARSVLSWIGWSVYLGFHIWEIVDVWLLTQPNHAKTADLMHERPWQNGWWGAQQTPNSANVLSLSLLSF